MTNIIVKVSVGVNGAEMFRETIGQESLVFVLCSGNERKHFKRDKRGCVLLIVQPRARPNRFWVLIRKSFSRISHFVIRECFEYLLRHVVDFVMQVVSDAISGV